MPACTHCGHRCPTPCGACRQGLACIGLCWACTVEAEAEPFETDEVPRVRIHPDGSTTHAEPVDLAGVPAPDAHLPPLDGDDIPF